MRLIGHLLRRIRRLLLALLHSAVMLFLFICCCFSSPSRPFLRPYTPILFVVSIVGRWLVQ